MMDNDAGSSSLSRRQLLRMIGITAGNAAMYQAMSSLGFAAESPYRGPIDLQGTPPGASILILGAGMAGMSAAYELRNAGYQVQVLEFNGRAGGRNWSLRGGDTYTELGGFTQHCQFDQDLYINPGPWRIPYHHRGMLHYCKTLGVPLEAFVQVNYNAYLHSSQGFGGKPQRYREVKADYQGHVHASECARCLGQQGRPGETARVAARLGCARQEFRLRGERQQRRSTRL
jgi:monoamine oxidase